MAENVRLQNLRDFTVQIRNANNEIVGTGIAVSTDGKVVTCAHVVEAAGVNPRVANGANVGIYFPQVREVERKNHQAKVRAFLSEYDDDVVLLQLIDDLAPLAPEQIAVLGTAFGSEGNNFRTYGFRHLAMYVAGWAEGIILGEVEAPIDKKLRLAPLQLNSNQIDAGMSGAAILDVERNLVVGFISETWYPQQSGKDSGTAWAVNATALAFPPFNLQVLGVISTIDQTQSEDELASKNRIYSGFKRVKLVDELIDRAATTDQPINQLSEDALGFSTYVRALRDFIASEETSTPLTISVDSPWGYGKTSLMRMLQSELDPPKSYYQSLKLFWVWLKWSFVYIFTSPI